ncbi:MAG: DUF948 domain-containing protein [Candidatus Protochlamydia sp.]|nr:DUF948 domain-containing protein [Candidatus Protochlamydia sp.]
MIIEISVAVIAVAFVFLVIYLIVLLKSLKSTMNQVNFLIFDARKQLDEMGGEAKKIIDHTNQISLDLKYKMETLNPLFQSVENIGEVLEDKAEDFKKSSIRSRTSNSTSPLFTHKDNLQNRDSTADPRGSKALVPDILELASLGIRLWQKLKKRR